MNDRVHPIFKGFIDAMTARMPDSNTTLLSQHETAQQILDKSPRDLPDFAYCREDVRDAGIPKEHQSAVMEIIQCFQMGEQCDQKELLKACAKLERSMLSVWKDEA